MAFKAFPKPGLASDILPIFKCKNSENKDQYFMLTGTRKGEPGKGSNATLGGFTGIEPLNPEQPGNISNPYILDSQIYTALKEGREEGNLKIKIPDIKNYREDYEASDIKGEVTCGSSIVYADGSTELSSSYQARIIKLKTIKTSDALMKDGGERLLNGEKRVYATTGYVCFVDLGEKIVNIADQTNDEFLKLFKFKAGSDVAGLQLNDITEAVIADSELKFNELRERMKFGIIHHNELLILAIKKIKEIFPGSP